MASSGGNLNRGGRRVKGRGRKFKVESGMNMKQKHEYDQNKQIVQIKKSLKEIKGGIELKYVDTALDGDINNTGSTSLFLLNGIAQGDNQITRTGGQIKLTSLQFRYRVATAATRLFYSTLRIIVFWDRQANGSTPAVIGDPIAGTQALLNNNLATIQPVEAPYQYENIDRFHVLYDKIVAMNPMVSTAFAIGTGITTAVAPIEIVVNKYIKLNRTTKYDFNSAAVSSINTNSLWMLVVSDLAATLPTGEGTARVYFKDA